MLVPFFGVLAGKAVNTGRSAAIQSKDQHHSPDNELGH